MLSEDPKSIDEGTALFRIKCIAKNLKELDEHGDYIPSVHKYILDDIIAIASYFEEQKNNGGTTTPIVISDQCSKNSPSDE